MRFAALLVAAFLAAVVAARLLLAGGLGWTLFALALPVVLLVLWRLLGLVPAVLVVGFFAAATLAVRGLLTTPRLGWGLLLVVPVLALSAYVALRVLLALRAPRGS